MMKYLLPFCLLLGCAPPQYYTPPTSPPPVVFDTGEGKLQWVCVREELTPKLIWNVCRFHNNTPETYSVCLQTIFYDLKSEEEVVSSRVFCSGMMMPDEVKEAYSAFINDKRKLVDRRCGSDLQACVMTNRVVSVENR